MCTAQRSDFQYIPVFIDVLEFLSIRFVVRGTKLVENTDFSAHVYVFFRIFLLVEIFNFRIGKGLLIPGWELGLLKMKKGSKRCLVIPHQLAYGHRGTEKIPSYSTLILK